MVDLAVREADFDRADSLYRRKEEKSRLAPRAVVVASYLRGDSVRLDSIFRAAERSRDRVPFIAAREIALYFGDLATAERLASAALQAPSPPKVRAFGHRTMAELQAARGRWRSALHHLSTSETLEEGSARELRAVLATLPFLPVDDGQVIEIRRDLQTWEPDVPRDDSAATGVREPTRLPDRLRPHLRLFLLGLLHAHRGGGEEALRAAVAIESLETPSVALPVRDALARTLRARVEADRGRPEVALGILREVRGQIPSDLLGLPVFAEEQARYLRAELLLRVGRDDEALRWLETGFAGTPMELVYTTPVHLRIAEIHDRAGRTAAARRHYARVAEAWAEADPPLRVRAEHARGRLLDLARPAGTPDPRRAPATPSASPLGG